MKIKKILALLLSVVLIFGITACDKKGGFTIEGGGSQQAVQAEVWTMPSTVKLLRDVDYSQYYDNKQLSYDMARNEYVSAQIMITPTSGSGSYDVSVSDLKSAGGTVFSKANFDVYHQHYVEVKTRTNPMSGRPLGYYPDALVPMASAKRAGENKIREDQNQGVWITAYAPKDLPAGIYTGEFTVKMGTTTEQVPVSIKVRDFAIPDEVHARSTFNLFPEYMIGGQLSNTLGTYKRFVDYMLDYRISSTEMVRVDTPVDQWAQQIKEYAKDPRVTSYNINTNEQLKALIELSEPGLNLLEDAYYYLKDEPYPDIPGAKTAHDQKIDELIEIANSYTVEELAEHGLTRADIEGVEVLITMTASIDTIEGLRTYAPLVSDLDTPFQREQYAQFREEAYKGKNNELAGTDYGTTWWYVCVHPYEPYPNYNIDMDLAASRVVSWMQYDYDIEGMLYWGSANYVLTTSMYDEPVGWQNSDVFNETNGVYRAANGDGYLVYPGARYGLDDPIPTIRLMNIRDGFQDYEYLYMLEELANEYAAKYKVSGFSFDSIMRSIYDKLYTGTKASTDFTLVEEAKSTVADMIELLSGELHGIIEVGETDAVAKKVPVTVYAEAGSELTVNGQKIPGTPSGSGVKFEVNVDIADGANAFVGTLSRGEYSYEINRFLTNDVKHVSAFDTEDSIKKWTASTRPSTGEEHITVSMNETADYAKSGASMKVEVRACEYDMLEQLNYLPYVMMKGEDFLGEDKFSDLESISFWVYNPGEAFTLKMTLRSETGSYDRTKEIYSANISSGWNNVKVTDIQKISWLYKGTDMMQSVTEVRLNFPLDSKNNNTLYFDDMYYSYKGENTGETQSTELKWLRDTSGEKREEFVPDRSGNPNLITSFESYQEAVNDFKFLNYFGSAKFVDRNGKDLSGAADATFPTGKNIVTDGQYALKVEAVGDCRVQANKPSLAVMTKSGGGTFDKYDFTDVDKIYLDVYNANDTPQNVYLQYLTDDLTGAKLTSANKVTVPAKTAMTVEFVIDRSFISQLLNLDQISQIRILFDTEKEFGDAPRIFYLDNFRIHTTKEPIDTSKPLRKENELESADRADYLSTWKNIGAYNWFPSSLSFNDDPQYIKGGTGSFKLSNVPGYYGPTSLNPVTYTVGWENFPMDTDVTDIEGIRYWVYNASDIPVTDWIRRTIREPGKVDDCKDGLYNTLQPGWNERVITKEQLLELGFKLDEFNIFTVMFSVPSQDACDLYLDEFMFF